MSERNVHERRAQGFAVTNYSIHNQPKWPASFLRN